MLAEEEVTFSRLEPLSLNYHKTILVVEDDLDDQTLIVDAFRSNGVENPIQVVNSGAQAIAYLMGEGEFTDRKKHPYPTFVMTDLKMPNGDGFSVLEHLKANPEWAVIPAVVLTASNDPDDVKKAYMLGASCYHQKPASHTELRQHLKTLHDYWMTCEIPEVDTSGRQVQTESKGKLGERFKQPSGEAQHRARD